MVSTRRVDVVDYIHTYITFRNSQGLTRRTQAAGCRARQGTRTKMARPEAVFLSLSERKLFFCGWDADCVNL